MLYSAVRPSSSHSLFALLLLLRFGVVCTKGVVFYAATRLSREKRRGNHRLTVHSYSSTGNFRCIVATYFGNSPPNRCYFVLHHKICMQELQQQCVAHNWIHSLFGNDIYMFFMFVVGGGVGCWM